MSNATPAIVDVQAIPVSTAQMALTGDPRAYMAHQPSDPDHKKYRLYTVIGDKRVHSRILESKSSHCEQLSKQVEEVWKRGHTLVKKHWKRNKDLEFSIGRLQITSDGDSPLLQADFRDKIEELIHGKYSDATQIEIHYEAESISFVRDGKQTTLKGDELKKELPGVHEILEFLSIWQQTHDTATSIFGIRNWHERLGISTNRPLHGAEPFVIKDNVIWDNFLPKTHEDFMRDHLPVLLEKRPDALSHVEKTHIFIEKFKQDIATKIIEKEAATPSPKEEIEHLKKMKEKLEAMNLYAIYWAAAYTNETDIGAARQTLTNDLIQTFKENRDLGQEKWSLNPRNWLFREKPSEDDLKIFAAQTGELLDHSGKFGQNFKKVSGPSVEEWVIHRMRNSENPSFYDDLAGLAIPDNLSSLKDEIRSITH